LARSFLVQNWCGRLGAETAMEMFSRHFRPEDRDPRWARKKNGRTRRHGRSDADEALDLTFA
jgi:hypothetical protein